MLDRTLVVMSEFGRSPKINAAAGRDHWPPYNVALFAGAGIRTARSSAPPTAKAPTRTAKLLPDVVTTIYSLLGLDLDRVYNDHLGRPWRSPPWCAHCVSPDLEA